MIHGVNIFMIIFVKLFYVDECAHFPNFSVNKENLTIIIDS